MRLRVVTQQLSSLSLSSEERQGLREKQEQLERRLYQLLPELKPRVVEVNDVASLLPDSGALIEFQRYDRYDGKKKPGERRGETRYLALVLTKEGSIEAIDLGLADLIEHRLEKALIASEERGPGAEALWAEVGELVMQPLEKALADVDTLVISPDGELNRLPFAALTAPSGGGLLGERYQLRLVTTGRELIDLEEPLVRKRGRALLVANPDFDLVLSRVRRDIASQIAQKKEERSVFADRGQKRTTETDQLVWKPLPGTKKEESLWRG